MIASCSNSTLPIVTVDCESDWGGRTTSLEGIRQMVPWLLEALQVRQLPAVFFLSTASLESYLPEAQAIQAAGHRLGSHGHAHHSWRWRPWYHWRMDYMRSRDLLKAHLGVDSKTLLYRAPHFSYAPADQPYASPRGHLGLLKALWMHRRWRPGQIVYCHPFDVATWTTCPPNPWCAVWYSRPQAARRKWLEILDDVRDATVPLHPP